MNLDVLIKSEMQEGDLVFGVVAAIEEEKDPRCLLLAFRIIQLLGRLYPDPDGPIASCADELFDVVSRYFPISFKPVSILHNFLELRNYILTSFSWQIQQCVASCFNIES